MSETIKYQPTPKKELRNMMRKIQEGLDIFLKLPKRKQHKRKNQDACGDLLLLKNSILRGYHHQMKIGEIQKWKFTISEKNELLSKSLR